MKVIAKKSYGDWVVRLESDVNSDVPFLVTLCCGNKRIDKRSCESRGSAGEYYRAFMAIAKSRFNPI